MANLCCCTCPLNLGCVSSCEMLDTTQVATKAGKYKMKYKFQTTWFEIESDELAIDDPIVFNISQLVFNYMYMAILIDPDGEDVEIMGDVISYDCISFKPQLTQ